MQGKNTAFFGAIVIVLLLIGYFFIDKQTLSQAEDEDGGPSSPGSAFGVFLLFVFIVAYGLQYLYSLLDPWDPLGLYQHHNRAYMGIVV